MLKSRIFRIAALLIILVTFIAVITLNFPQKKKADAAALNAIGANADPDVILSATGFSPSEMDIQAGMAVAFHNETTNNYTLVGIPLAGLPLYQLFLPIIHQQTAAQNQGTPQTESPAGDVLPGPTSCAFQVPFPAGAIYIHKYTHPGVCGYSLVDSTLSGEVTVNHAFGPATLTGRLLDTTSVLNGEEDPVVGATVSLLGTSYSAVSDVQGYFTIPNITPPGSHVLDINTANAQPALDGSPYASFREEFFVIGGMTNTVERPFYLPRIDPDSLTTVIPAQTTTVNNPNLDITMTVPPNTALNEEGTPFTGQLSISEVPQGLAPAMMPPELQSGLLITVQPVGVTFNTPAPITFPNFDNLAVGNELDLWSLDPETGSFVVVGTGEVVQNGSETEIQIIEGGIRAADWHFFLPPFGNGMPPENQDNQGGVPPQECPGASAITVYDGCIKTEFSIPSYTSLGENHTMTFVYKSDRAYPQIILPFEMTIPTRAAVPPQASYQLSIAGINWGDRIYLDTADLSENQDETLRGTVAGDASYLATGVYPYNLQFTSHYASSQISSNSGGAIIVISGQESPFGPGWEISGLQRIFNQQDGTILISEGSGKATRFNSGAFIYDGFSELSGFVLNGATALANSSPVISNGKTVLRLTNAGNQAGSAFLNTPIILSESGLPNSFSTNFQFQLLEASGSQGGGDGFTLAFVTAPNSLGSNGGYLGFGGIDPSVGIEIDTYNNGASWDNNDGNHIGIDLNGNLASIITRSIEEDFLNGAIWNVWVDYDGGNHSLEIRLAPTSTKPENALIAHTVDLESILGQSSAYVGFTAGTAAARSTQDIRYWSFTLSTETNGQYFGPPGDFSTLFRNEDNTFTRILRDGTHLEFNQRGLQTATIDRNGNTTTYTYDASDRLTTITDPAGIITTFTYTDGLVSSVTNPGGTTTFQHDAQGNLTGVTFPDGSEQTFGYDPRHLMTSETDANGHLTQRTYNEFGQLTSATLPGGIVRATTASQLVGWVPPGSGTETDPAPITRPEDAVSTFMDGEGHTTTFVTGQFGEATQITDPAGFITTLTRDADGNPTQTTLPSGAIFDRTFDDRGNPLTFTDQTLDGTTTFTYEPVFNQLTTLTNPFNQTTTFTYDALGNLTGITTPLNRTVTFDYNSQGLVTSLTDPLGMLTAYTYNAQGNLTALAQGTGPDQRTASLTYTSEGYVETLTDPLARLYSFIYDELGRLTSETFPGGRTIAYTYDDTGNLTSLTPPGRPAHTFTYTGLNLLETYTAPTVPGGGTNQTSYAYNDAQQLDLITRPDNLTLDYAYDPFGRLTTLTIPRGTLNYAYSPTTGHLTGITDPGGVGLTYTYNGEILTHVAWNGPLNGFVGYTYDEGARLAQLNVNGTPHAFTYDSDDALTHAGALTLAYHPTTGLLTGTTLSGVTDSWTFNAFAELSGYSAAYNAANVFAATYTRDALGRITQKVETVNGVTETWAYTYDPAGRLATVTLNGGQIATYTYDLNGNRQSDGTNAATYDAQDRLLTYGPNTYTYTPNGELLTKTTGGQTTTYTYDALGNLLAVTLPYTTALTYLVDGEGRRVGKQVNGTLTQGWLYSDALNPVAELDGAGNVVSTFLYASQANVPDYMVKGGITYRILSDHLGSVRLVLNAQTGALAQQINYDAFGRVTQDTNPGFQPFGFAGGLYDPDTGLVRFGARDYDAEVGRWTAKDPIGFAGEDTNLYGYINNDPNNFIDPSGLDSPGCDWFPDCAESQCVKQACAAHDFCYKQFGCTAQSWADNKQDICDICNVEAAAGIMACGIQGTNPLLPSDYPQYYDNKTDTFSDVLPPKPPIPVPPIPDEWIYGNPLGD